ncbi:hypothetical protein T484DRAFT_1969206, partial [Baffinella frigidus]
MHGMPKLFGRDAERPATAGAAPAKAWLPSLARLKSLLTPRSGCEPVRAPRAHFPSAHRGSVDLERPPNCLVHRRGEDCDCEQIALPLATSYDAGQLLRRRYIERSVTSPLESSARRSSWAFTRAHTDEVCNTTSEFTAECSEEHLPPLPARSMPTRSTGTASNSTRSTESASSRRRELRLRSKDFGVKTAGNKDNDFYRAAVSLADSPKPSSPSTSAARESMHDAVMAYYNRPTPTPAPPTPSTDKFPSRTLHILPTPASRVPRRASLASAAVAPGARRASLVH